MVFIDLFKPQRPPHLRWWYGNGGICSGLPLACASWTGSSSRPPPSAGSWSWSHSGRQPLPVVVHSGPAPGGGADPAEGSPSWKAGQRPAHAWVGMDRLSWLCQLFYHWDTTSPPEAVPYSAWPPQSFVWGIYFSTGYQLPQGTQEFYSCHLLVGQMIRDRHIETEVLQLGQDPILPALPSAETPQLCLTGAAAVLTPSHLAPPFTNPLSKFVAQSAAFLQEQTQVAWRGCGLRKSLWGTATNLNSNLIHKGWRSRASSNGARELRWHM